MAVHRWVNKYRVPLPQSAVISEVKPGQQIAKCITEIQEQIDVLAVGGGLPDMTGVTNRKTLQVLDETAVWDWVRFV